MSFTSPFVKSLIIVCLGSGFPSLPSAFADEASPAKKGEKAPLDEGGIAAGTVLPDCDGALISPFDRHPSDYAGTSVAVGGESLIIGAGL